jgi:hypothetical protein
LVLWIDNGLQLFGFVGWSQISNLIGKVQEARKIEDQRGDDREGIEAWHHVFVLT